MRIDCCARNAEASSKGIPVLEVTGPIFCTKWSVSVTPRWTIVRSRRRGCGDVGNAERFPYLFPKARCRETVDDHVQWLESRPDYETAAAVEYRKAKSSEQLRIAEDRGSAVSGCAGARDHLTTFSPKDALRHVFPGQTRVEAYCSTPAGPRDGNPSSWSCPAY